MVALTLTQLIKDLQKVEIEARQRGGMPKTMPVNLPCRAAIDLSLIRYDVVKVTVRLGDSVLLHFFREDLSKI